MPVKEKKAVRKKPHGRDAVFVLAADGTRLMPTFNAAKVRKLLRSGKAEIFCYRPYFTIKLTYTPEEPGSIPVELCLDTGSEHIGLSLKSEKHEYISEQRDNLPDEKEKHEAQARLRRSRRNRKRHRRPRPFRDHKKKGWLAPSLEHKMENHVRLAKALMEVCPVADVWAEMGSFDTQALAAIEQGKPLPEGKDYQQGPRYRHDTLREAVFYRDGYKCILCGASGMEKDTVLREHHIGFWRGDHSDRMGNLATLCCKCHIPSNHKPGEKLWGWEPELAPLDGAAFMNTVRWKMYAILKGEVEKRGASMHMTYGAVTKRERLNRHMHKSHANDAYCIGKLHPKHRTRTRFYKKKRKNNRCLQKFVDAKYIDIRDGEKKNAGQLGCNRTRRRESRRGEKNFRIYRGRKVAAGYFSYRRSRYEIRPGDPLLYKGRKVISAGVNSNGKYVTYQGVREFSLDDAAPAVDRHGKEIPVMAGNMCVLTVRYAPKEMVLDRIDCGKGTASLLPVKTKGRRKAVEAPLSDILPAKDSAGKDIPLKEGNHCVYAKVRSKKKIRLLSVNGQARTVCVKWVFAVPVDEVKLLRNTGGWQRYEPAELFIY